VHTTADPGVFMAEIDTVLNGPAGTTTISLVQIFRFRGRKIALLRGPGPGNSGPCGGHLRV
jgi:hypothetical protein